MKLIKRILLASLGMMIYGLGNYLTIQANIGVGPWEALNIGISQTLGILYGTASIAVGACIILLDICLKAPIGIGTILNMLIIGKTVDLLNWLDLIPKLNSIPAGIALMLLGFLVVGFGMCIYFRQALSCGPRDTLMIALGKRIDRVPIGLVNNLIFLVVTIVSWMLHAPIGLGTLIAVFGSGLMYQLSYRITRFDPKSVKHESFQDMFAARKS